MTQHGHCFLPGLKVLTWPLPACQLLIVAQGSSQWLGKSCILKQSSNGATYQIELAVLNAWVQWLLHCLGWHQGNFQSVHCAPIEFVFLPLVHSSGQSTTVTLAQSVMNGSNTVCLCSTNMAKHYFRPRCQYHCSYNTHGMNLPLL